MKSTTCFFNCSFLKSKIVYSIILILLAVLSASFPSYGAQIIDVSDDQKELTLELTPTEQLTVIIGSNIYLSFYLPISSDQDIDLDSESDQQQSTDNADPKPIVFKQLLSKVTKLDDDLVTLSLAEDQDLTNHSLIGIQVKLSKHSMSNDDFVDKKLISDQAIGLSLGLYSGFDSRSATDLGVLLGYTFASYLDSELNYSTLGRYQRGRASYKVTNLGFDLKPYVYDRIFGLVGVSYIHYKEKFNYGFTKIANKTRFSKSKKSKKSQKFHKQMIKSKKYHDQGLWLKLGTGTSLDYDLSYGILQGISVGLQLEYSVLVYQISESYQGYTPIGSKVLGNHNAFLGFRMSIAALF